MHYTPSGGFGLCGFGAQIIVGINFVGLIERFCDICGMKPLFRIILLSACALCVIACDDENKKNTKKNLAGAFDYPSLPEYVAVGEQFSVDGSGVTIPDSETDKALKMFYAYSYTGHATTDTLETSQYSFTIPDTLGAFSFKCVAIVEGYYTKTGNLSSTIVAPRSLQFTRPAGESTFTDPRDGRSYHCLQIGDDVWMTDNLCYGGTAYYERETLKDVYGSFYTFKEAQSACPDGWEIPTAAQWDALGTVAGDLMANATFNREEMWEFWPEVNITNAKGFNAVPFGYATLPSTTIAFVGFNEYATFWSSNQGKAECRYIFVSNPTVEIFPEVDDESFFAPLRCVKQRP